jgi:HD-GYP domain-containing protein (c-di-GMP phosphodiesterase class II)
MKKKVNVSELKPGMFVEELDRPWVETPFPLQGVLIKTTEDIVEMTRYCQNVFITVLDEKPKFNFNPKPNFKIHEIPEDDGKKSIFHGDHVYTNTKTIEEELPVAKKAYQKATVLLDQIKEGIERDFKLNVEAAKQLVFVIANSIVRNPDAMLFLNQSGDNRSPAHYKHAINSATHMIAFGRHLCLSTEELSILGLGGLLMDIGQLKLPMDERLKGSDLFHKETSTLKEHVTYGVAILKKMPGIPDVVVDITTQHHEREDGSGYPNGLCSNEIVPYARMAAIVDTYDKITTKGLSPDLPPSTPFEALKILWDWTRKWLNPVLVQQFAYCIGLFPIGSLVELNTGEVGIVLAHNRTKRLLPRIMIILDAGKKPISEPRSVDLIKNPLTPNGIPYEIIKDLGFNAYGIDPKKYYL